MKEIIAKFPEQVREAISIAESIDFKNINKKFENILVCGLGGSGIGGKIIGQLFADELKIPFLTDNDYTIPEFVSDKTLVIASSYSGNTEETISAVNESRARGAEIAVITSGGSLKKMAEQNRWSLAVIPGGEQPRAMLVYSLIQQVAFLTRYGLIGSAFMEKLKAIPSFIEGQEDQIIRDARQLAEKIENFIPVIYAGTSFEGVAIRFRQQLNENSKVLCWHHILPELTHNELVGWAGGDERFALIYLNSSLNHPRTQKRWEICREIIGKKTHNINEIKAMGGALMDQIFYLIHFTDWVSLFLAEKRGVDPIEVNVIGYLKDEMAKMR